MSIVKQIIERGVSNTPPFWKKIRNIVGGFGVLALIASKVPLIPDPYRTILHEVGQYCITIGATAQFTTTNTSLLKQ